MESFQTGFAGVLFSIALVAEWFANNKSKSISSIPENLLFPPKAVKNTLFVIFGLSFLFLESGLLYLSLIVLMVMWGRIADKSVIGTSSEEADKTILYVLGFLAFASFFFSVTTNYGGAFGEFFFQTQWTPTGACADRRSLCENMSFGVNSLLDYATSSLWCSFHRCSTRSWMCNLSERICLTKTGCSIKPTLEILAGIPSVVYGFFAFIYIGPIVVQFGEFAFGNGWIDQPPNILNPINGAIVVGIMILPLVASMSEDALRAVPNELREGSLALGATRIETTLRVMLQASLSGILASIILALSRAVGETMAVTLAVGTVAVYTSNMFLPAQTMTAYIAQRVGGDLPFGEIGYLTIFAVGLYLFAITLALNLLGNKVLSTYREAY